MSFELVLLQFCVGKEPVILSDCREPSFVISVKNEAIETYYSSYYIGDMFVLKIHFAYNSVWAPKVEIIQQII